MLNYFKSSKKNTTQKNMHKFQPATFIQNPSSVREWKNSIYVYNKTNLNLIPVVTSKAMKLIKLYFSLYSSKLERKLRRMDLQHKKRILSSYRIFLSNGEFKHTNNNVLVNIYVYNRQMKNIIYKYSKKLSLFFNKKNKKNQKILKNFIEFTKENKTKLENGFKNNIFKGVNLDYKEPSLLIDLLNKFCKDKRIYNYLYDKPVKTIINTRVKKIRRKKSLISRKIRDLMYYKNLIDYNSLKLDAFGLLGLKTILQDIYNKNVDLNIVSLNRFYLNSDILYESVKLKLTKNRRKMGRLFKKLHKKVKVFVKRKVQYKVPKLKFHFKDVSNSDLLKNYIFNTLKYKHVTGFRLEARGRLTRRNTASRSVYKLNYNGNLLNIDSSLLGLSSVILKGNLRSNLQYTQLNSQTRIGSFGLKGWVSGY